MSAVQGSRGWVPALVALGLVDVAITSLGATGLVLPPRQGLGGGLAGATPVLIASLLLLLVALAGHVAVAAVVLVGRRDACAASSAGIAVLLDAAVVALSVVPGFWWPQVLYLVAGLAHLALVADTVRALNEDEDDPSPCRRTADERDAYRRPESRLERGEGIRAVSLARAPLG